MLVLDGGHPSACSPAPTCSAFLAGRGTGREPAEPTSRRLRDPGDPRRPGRPTRRPARSCRRSRLRPRSRRTRSASTAGYEYARSGNPTRAALETCLASLEGARARASRSPAASPPRTRSCACSSPATTCHPRRRLRRHVPARRQVHERRGHRVDASPTSPTSTRSTPRGADDTALVWIETPTNPLLVDRRHRGGRASSRTTRGARVVVDNTFATPYLQQPLALGADVVVHSTTKYLGGHSDVVGGFVAVDDAELAERARASCRTRSARCRRRSTATSCCAGVKTLAVRMDRHCDERRGRSSTMLAAHPAVDRVLYPGSPTIPATTSRARQMRDFGGMVSLPRRRRRGRRARARGRAPGCSRWPSRSARSSRSSSTRRG